MPNQSTSNFLEHTNKGISDANNAVPESATGPSIDSEGSVLETDKLRPTKDSDIKVTKNPSAEPQRSGKTAGGARARENLSQMAGNELSRWIATKAPGSSSSNPSASESFSSPQSSFQRGFHSSRSSSNSSEVTIKPGDYEEAGD